MKLIIGLGNPGKKYENTRHNVGFKVVEEIMQNSKFKNEKRFSAEVCQLTPEILLIKPQTFMNASGEAVKKLVTYYKQNFSSNKIPTTDLWVIHDDVDIPLGKMKIRIGGSGAGHHGVESIIKSLGTDKFVRFRLGVGHPGRPMEMGEKKEKKVKMGIEEYVVKPFEDHEKTLAEHLLKKGVDAVELALKEGLPKAMSKFNG